MIHHLYDEAIFRCRMCGEMAKNRADFLMSSMRRNHRKMILAKIPSVEIIGGNISIEYTSILECYAELVMIILPHLRHRKIILPFP